MGLCYGDGSLLAILLLMPLNALGVFILHWWRASQPSISQELPLYPWPSIFHRPSGLPSPSKGPALEESACQPSQSHFPVIVRWAEAYRGGHTYSETGVRHYRRQTANVYLHRALPRYAAPALSAPLVCLCLCLCMHVWGKCNINVNYCWNEGMKFSF